MISPALCGVAVASTVGGGGVSTGAAASVAGGVSGAHLNPAVTVALAVHRGLPWGKVLPYTLAQIAGYSSSRVRAG